MLDRLLKSKYHTKCKNLLRMVKARLEVLKKKKCSVVKFLKNDVADLLRNGLDSNAYGRVQGILDEQKTVTCYSLIEQFCDLVYNNVNAMANQRECPEDCKEAVQSLMYAAARVSEIPELRDLRKVFTERYTNSLKPDTNKQFAETFMPVFATKETKLELLNKIAAEYKLKWNSKSLENELCKVVNKGKTNGNSERYDQPRISSKDEEILSSSSSVGTSDDGTVFEHPQLQCKHVDPNLPDGFNDLSARLAALGGK